MREDRQRLDDILAAASAIASHLERGSLADGLIFDAVRVRLIEIGEAVKDIDPELLAAEPDLPWAMLPACEQIDRSDVGGSVAVRRRRGLVEVGRERSQFRSAVAAQGTGAGRTGVAGHQEIG